MSQRIVILTEGHSNPHTAKTACSVIRYRRDEVVAVLDSTQAHRRCQELLGVGDDLRMISSLDEARQANCLMIGIAPPGGKIPEDWRAIVLDALRRGMTVISGLHDFLGDDPEFSAAAAQHDARLIDVRRTDFKQIARRGEMREGCFRVHTVGHDCSIGKMVASIELARGLKARGHDAKFIATGQTGIMVEGDGLPMDAVVADFVSGAAESLIQKHQDHEFLLVEGQGSLVHPSYSSVTLGILHGCDPHALILCFEVGRERITGVEHMIIPPLTRIRELCETMAGIWRPCPVIGVAMNGRRVTVDQAERERERVQQELGLPVCDVFRDGPDRLIDAILAERDQRLQPTSR